MFGSIALDIVIGLVFVYLLYSLFATVLSEIIATKIGLRARNLKEGIDRMLSDEKEMKGWHRLMDSIKFLKNAGSPITEEFYNHPEIKYLGSSGVFKNPSSFKSVSFSKTLLNLFSNDQPITRAILDSKLGLADADKSAVTITRTLKNVPREITLDSDTSKYLRIIWAEANGDIEKFKFLLEGWFDRTMEQATEWYKRKIQVILLVLGFFIAWFFNADTFTIIHKLSVDKDARDKMVSMANAYIQSHPRPADHVYTAPATSAPPPTTADPNKKGNTGGSATTTPSMPAGDINKPGDSGNNAEYKRRIDSLMDVKNKMQANIDNNAAYKRRIDSLMDVKNKIQADIDNANTLLGLGGWLPDSLPVKRLKGYYDQCWFSKDSVYRSVFYSAYYDHTFERDSTEIHFDKSRKTGIIYFTTWPKVCFLGSLFRHHFFGFLITAIAISLGAPFWFDLLNKLMKLRTSAKQSTNSTESNDGKVTLDKRVG